MAAAAQGQVLRDAQEALREPAAAPREKYVSLAKEIGLTSTSSRRTSTRTPTPRRSRRKQGSRGHRRRGTPASFVNGRYSERRQAVTRVQGHDRRGAGWAKAGNRPEFKIGKNVSEASAKPAATASGPDPNKVYDIAAGKAPYKGPEKAKVVILHYYDYQ
jgi:hypothetical protein